MKRSGRSVELDVKGDICVWRGCLDMRYAVGIGNAGCLYTVDSRHIVAESQRIACFTIGNAEGLPVGFLNGERHGRYERCRVCESPMITVLEPPITMSPWVPTVSTRAAFLPLMNTVAATPETKALPQVQESPLRGTS